MKKILIVCSVLLLLSLGSSQDPGMVLNYMVDVTRTINIFFAIHNYSNFLPLKIIINKIYIRIL